MIFLRLKHQIASRRMAAARAGAGCDDGAAAPISPSRRISSRGSLPPVALRAGPVEGLSPGSARAFFIALAGALALYAGAAVFWWLGFMAIADGAAP